MRKMTPVTIERLNSNLDPHEKSSQSLSYHFHINIVSETKKVIPKEHDPNFQKKILSIMFRGRH